MTERRAAAAPPASLRGPDSSHSNTRTGRDRACIELDGQVSRHHNLLPNSLSQRSLALLWQILSGTGFPNQFFCDSWVVGFWRGRPWLAGRRIGKKSLDAFSSRFWVGWVTRRGDKCVHSTCRG